MYFDGVLRDTFLGQEVRNLEPLVTLKLDDLSSLLIFDEGTVASEFLTDRTKSALGQPMGVPCRQGRLTFLKALRSFLESYSAIEGTTTMSLLTRGGVPQVCSPFGTPCKVVNVLRPFRCWMRIWM